MRRDRKTRLDLLNPRKVALNLFWRLRLSVVSGPCVVHCAEPQVTGLFFLWSCLVLDASDNENDSDIALGRIERGSIPEYLRRFYFFSLHPFDSLIMTVTETVKSAVGMGESTTPSTSKS